MKPAEPAVSSSGRWSRQGPVPAVVPTGILTLFPHHGIAGRVPDGGNPPRETVPVP